MNMAIGSGLERRILRKYREEMHWNNKNLPIEIVPLISKYCIKCVKQWIDYKSGMCSPSCLR
jgi:hypothetical protein